MKYYHNYYFKTAIIIFNYCYLKIKKVVMEKKVTKKKKALKVKEAIMVNK